MSRHTRASRTLSHCLRLSTSNQSRPAIFDEYTRRQYVAKAPERNPFGEDDEPNKFDDFDVFTKIRVLQQLSTWTLNNPNSIRERLAATDHEQTLWVSIGWVVLWATANRATSAWNPPAGTRKTESCSYWTTIACIAAPTPPRLRLQRAKPNRSPRRTRQGDPG